MKMYHVYKVTNKKNGKIYVGKTKHLKVENRLKEHFYSALHESKPSCPLFYNAIKSYGVENFYIEILESFPDEKDSLAAEDRYVNLLDSRNRKIGYNIAKGGNSGALTSEGLENFKKNRAGKNCGSLNKFAKLDDEKVLSIRQMFENGINQKELTEKFNVSYKTIYGILRNLSWKHVRPCTKVPTGKSNIGKGEKAPKSKLNDLQVKEIKNRLSKAKIINIDLIKEIAKINNVSISCIKSIMQKKSWSHIDEGGPCYFMTSKPKKVKPIKSGRCRGEDNSKNKNAKNRLTDCDVLEIRKLFENNIKISEISKITSFSEKRISSIVYNETWTHLPLCDGKKKTRQNKLTKSDVIAIRAEIIPANMETVEFFSIIGNKYNVSKHTIRDVWYNYKWKDV